MEWLKNNKDKVYHFVVCFVMVALFRCFLPLHLAAFLPLVIAIVGKEMIWDWLLKKGTPDIADVCFDIFGVFCGTLVVGLLFG